MTPTNAPADPIIARIKKLLALAGNNDNAEEAATAAGEAQRLMLKHQIEQAVLSDGAAPVERQDVQPASGKRRAVMWQALLANVVGKHFNVKVIMHAGSDQVSAIGRGPDVAATALLYHHLRGQLERAAERAWYRLPHVERRAYQIARGGKIRWIDTFHRGARDVIDARMADQKRVVALEIAADPTRPCDPCGYGADAANRNAMVLMNAYADEARAAISSWQATSDFKSTTFTRYSHSAGEGALGAGQAAGRAASLTANARSLGGG